MVNSAAKNRQKQNQSSRKANKEISPNKAASADKKTTNYIIIAAIGAICLGLIATRTDLLSSLMRQESKTDSSSIKQNRDVFMKAITNKFDSKIAKELKKAQKVLDQGNFEKAFQEFSFLSTKYKSSPRARFGKAQALDQKADSQRSNSLVLEAAEIYKEASEIEGCPDELKKFALKRMANRLEFLGKSGRAARVYELLSVHFPNDAEILNDFGIQLLVAGDTNKALKIFKKALQINPTDGCAKSHVGFILKSEEKLEESIPYFEEGLKSGEPRSGSSKFYYHLGDAYQRLGNYSAARRVYETGAKEGHFLSAMQRSLYNADTKLKAQPWWTLRETGYAKDLARLESNWKTIRDEAAGLLDVTGKGGFKKEDEGLQDVGDWRQLTLYTQGKRSYAGCQRAPKTCDIVSSMASAIGCKRGQIKFSVMYPGTHVWPHCGPTNCRLRAHLGLVIPDGVFISAGGEMRTWKEGKVLVFDDSFEHEVWHNGTSVRMILIIDFWHPDLTKRQRQTLTPI